MADLGITGADTTNIPLERSFYVGNILCGVLYGVEISVFFATIYSISHRPPGYRKGQRFYVVYGGILLALVTINVAVGGVWGQYMWIDHRNDPGGPLGFYAVTQGTWYNVFRFAANATGNVLTDWLLVYRCFIIWDSKWRIIALPTLIYLTSSVFSIVAVVESAIPGASLQSGMPIRLAVLWVSLSVSLNVIVTSMICFRLMRMRALARDVLSSETSSIYTSIAAMLIESAAPFSIIGIIFVVTAAQRVPPLFAFALVWSMFCSLSSQMIILRVAMGRAWLKGTVNEINSALVFAEPSMAQSQQSQGSRMTVFNPEDPIYGLRTSANEPEKSDSNC